LKIGKPLICVFSKATPYRAPCMNPRKYVLCWIAKKFLPLDEIIDAVGKAIYVATTGNIPEGIELEDLPHELKQFVIRKKKETDQYRV